MKMFPKLLIKKNILKQNIARIKKKCDLLLIDLRPHVKTIHDARLSYLLKEQGIEKISVSNIDMLDRFIDEGWTDISLSTSFPINYIEKLNEILKPGISLSVYIDSLHQLNALSDVKQSVNICIEIDAGQCRSGISWKYIDQISNLITKVKESKHSFSCLVSHFGDLYDCKNKDEIHDLFSHSMMKILNLKDQLDSMFNDPIKISIGDTPSILHSKGFEHVFELRAGNFMLNDLMIQSKGLCNFSDIGCVFKAQVISKSDNDSRFVLHCGSVHLSKEKHSNDFINYGLIASVDSDWPDIPLENTSIVDLYQEHAVVISTPSLIKKVEIGDYFWIYPVHSCLAMDAMFHKNKLEFV